MSESPPDQTLPAGGANPAHLCLSSSSAFCFECCLCTDLLGLHEELCLSSAESWGDRHTALLGTGSQKPIRLIWSPRRALCFESVVLKLWNACFLCRGWRRREQVARDRGKRFCCAARVFTSPACGHDHRAEAGLCSFALACYESWPVPVSPALLSADKRAMYTVVTLLTLVKTFDRPTLHC